MTGKRNAFEIAIWPCSKEYVKDQSIVHPALDMLDGQLGLDEIFYGVQVEKPIAYSVLNWHTMEAHESFAADKERLHKFVKMFEASAKDGVPQGEMIHVSWVVSEALPCLEAPVTEIRKVKAREGVTLEAVQATLNKYVRYVLSDGAVGATYGPVIETPGEIGLVIGWKIIEAREESREEREIREITEDTEEISVVLLKQHRKRVM